MARRVADGADSPPAGVSALIESADESQLDESGRPASGRIGADDPLLAFEDAVREFGPDHLLIALRRADRAGGQEQGLVETLLERFGRAPTVFEIDR